MVVATEGKAMVSVVSEMRMLVDYDVSCCTETMSATSKSSEQM